MGLGLSFATSKEVESRLSRSAGWVAGWVGAWDRKAENKAKLSPALAGAWLSLAIMQNLDKYCPVKEMKISSKDKPFINAELKRIDRQKKREYQKRDKTEKFKYLKKQFDTKYKEAAKNYLNKDMDELRGELLNLDKPLVC